MRVEKLELIGFKSFGDKITIDLHPGITSIVGPNGCGKSNVVDAFKWVLGEQSVKSLRGGKMQEVIFAGTDSRKPRGMAEVSLHVTGLGSAGNGSENVTVVTRRLFRSGESDYLLNRKSCRLRDIRDIFLDTGLELKSYSMLEQDRVSSILAARPDERRFIIEEVAGVVKYKVRRNEAKNKLENSRNNLARINDITGEVRRQLNSLDRQAKKAERYKRLMEQLKDIEVRIARRQYGQLSEVLAEVNQALAAIKEEDAALRAETSSAEGEIESMRIDLAEKDSAMQSVQSELRANERSMNELESAIAVSRTERDHMRGGIERLGKQKDENAAKRQSALAKESALEAQTLTLRQEITALEARVAEKDGELKAIEAGIREREHNLETKRRDSFRAADALGAMRNEEHRYASSLESLQKKKDGLEKESEELRQSITFTEAQGREIQSGMQDRNNRLVVYRDDIAAMKAEAARMREELEKRRASLAKAREDLASATSRLESLREMDFTESSEEELRGGVEIMAALSDVIEAPGQYERAIESALKEKVQGFVVNGTGGIRDAVRVVDEKGMGRTAFIAADVARRSQGTAPSGAVAMAMDLVRVRQGFENVAANLLGNVAIMRDLESALAAGGTQLTLVTVSGEVIEPSGAVVAGKSLGILALKRQVRELTAEIEKMRATIASMESGVKAAEEALAEKEARLTELGDRAVEAEKDLSLLRLRAEKNAEEAERLARKRAHLKVEMEEIDREREGLTGMLQAKGTEIQSAEGRKTEAEAAIAAIAAEIASRRDVFEGRRAESVEARLSLNSARERIGSIGKEQAAVRELMDELGRSDASMDTEVAGLEARIVKLAEEAAAKEETLKALALNAGEITSRMNALRVEIEQRTETVREKEKALRTQRARMDDISHRLNELDVRRAENALKLDNLITTIRNNYAVELPAMEPAEVTPEDEELLPELRKKIEAIGPVSLGSIEEYEELKTRHDFLSQQQEDLEKSIAELEEAIARINATTRKKLREAYDALRVKFSEVFVNLFGGGRAELVLTDETNILETGIDIIAQPPGKRFQNITLLSGGEKTLTALALLFAGFLIKPTPLCIMDEADAALDESNTHKFAELIKRMSRDIQFIVVTHNRVTMEKADFIYGVTMEEPGNSKVISMEMAGT